MIILTFVVGGLIGAIIARQIYIEESSLNLADAALSSVASGIRVAAMLQSGDTSKSKIIRETEQSTALSIVLAREAAAPIKHLGYRSLQGLCAAYIYIGNGGFNDMGAPDVKNLLKEYLDKYGPKAISRLKTIRATLGNQRFKLKSAHQIGVPDQSKAERGGKQVANALSGIALNDCYKGPTE